MYTRYPVTEQTEKSANAAQYKLELILSIMLLSQMIGEL